MKNHKHYETARRAYYWFSFSPEKRAESECQFFDEINAEFEAAGVDEAGKAKFERLFLLSLAAKSRCASSMVTGPARFNVEKNRRANERERKVSDELLAYIDRVRKAIDKEKHPENYPADAIRSDDENAIDKLKQKLAKLQKAQEQMKACNKIIRDKKDNKIERLAEILGTKERAKELLEPDWCGRIGFTSFDLTNNNAAIKTAQSRINEIEKMEKVEEKEEEINGVKVIQNKEEMRLQLIFDGKPAEEMINLLKSKGFKWSPRFGAWQRLLNENCLKAFNYYIKPKLA
jgi:hypothetical protein